MCLNTKYSLEQKRDWLKSCPEVVIAYKVVKILNVQHRDGTKSAKLVPPFMYNQIIRCGSYKRVNRLRATTKTNRRVSCMDNRSSRYMAYYHLFLYEDDAEIWKDGMWNGSFKVIKCTIPKKLITDVGLQDGFVIVTKGFDIVCDDKKTFDETLERYASPVDIM